MQNITGDAVEEMRRLNEASVDLVLADPPYNLVKKHDIKKRFDE